MPGGLRARKRLPCPKLTEATTPSCGGSIPGDAHTADRTTRGRTDQTGTRRPDGASADAGGRWTPLAHPSGHQLRQSPGWVACEVTSTWRTAGNASARRPGPHRSPEPGLVRHGGLAEVLAQDRRGQLAAALLAGGRERSEQRRRVGDD